MGRITSRHESWSTPDYYQISEEKMKKRLEMETKQKLLTERQERLKAELAQESVQLDNEMKGKIALIVFSMLLKLIF